MTEREEQAVVVLNTLHDNPLLSDIHRQALEVGIMAIKVLSSSENPNKWIPVESALPEVVVGEHDIRCSEDVLVYDGDDLRVGYFVRIEKFDRGYWNIYGDDCFEPIAWMQLPQPYKAESEDKE